MLCVGEVSEIPHGGHNAVAHEAGVPFTIEDFDAIGKRIPLVGNLSPHGGNFLTTWR